LPIAEQAVGRLDRGGRALFVRYASELAAVELPEALHVLAARRRYPPVLPEGVAAA
jgi:hypothetical protein